MTLRLRLTLVAAAVVALVVAAASVTTYFVMKHELYSQVDATIGQHAADLQREPTDVFRGLSPYAGDFVTFVEPAGGTRGDTQPINTAMRQVAAGHHSYFYRDVSGTDTKGRTLHVGNVQEDILRAIIGLDEAVALVRVEPLYGAD